MSLPNKQETPRRTSHNNAAAAANLTLQDISSITLSSVVMRCPAVGQPKNANSARSCLSAVVSGSPQPPLTLNRLHTIIQDVLDLVDDEDFFGDDWDDDSDSFDENMIFANVPSQ